MAIDRYRRETSAKEWVYLIPGTATYLVTAPYFSCRCGKAHEGAYAQEEWNHHNCFHDEHLAQIAKEQAVCIQCGKSFKLEDAFGPPEAPRHGEHEG